MKLVSMAHLVAVILSCQDVCDFEHEIGVRDSLRHRDSVSSVREWFRVAN